MDFLCHSRGFAPSTIEGPPTNGRGARVFFPLTDEALARDRSNQGLDSQFGLAGNSRECRAGERISPTRAVMPQACHSRSTAALSRLPKLQPMQFDKCNQKRFGAKPRDGVVLRRSRLIVASWEIQSAESNLRRQCNLRLAWGRPMRLGGTSAQRPECSPETSTGKHSRLSPRCRSGTCSHDTAPQSEDD
jgi:hypothetical protein